MSAFINVYDYEKAAHEKMDGTHFDYYAGGANDEITLRENEAAYRRIKLYHRILQKLGPRDLSTTVLGHEIDMPILVAPAGFQALAHEEGELDMVRGAGRMGTIMILSTASTRPMEAVLAEATGPVWFQLYMYRDRAITAGLVERAQKAGCEAIVLTVDTPVLGRRERDIRNKFTLPPGLSLENFTGQAQGDMPSPTAGSGLAAYTADMFKFDLSWEDVTWLQSVTDLPILLKGVAHPTDARLAMEHGVDGLIVSNHGGRQLDTGPATIDLLPGIVAAVDGRLPILLDGGIRRGSDVLKALALGADAVAVGRPALWGLAADGADGVAHVLHLLRDELDNAMALCGVDKIADITAELIFSGR